MALSNAQIKVEVDNARQQLELKLATDTPGHRKGPDEYLKTAQRLSVHELVREKCRVIRGTGLTEPALTVALKGEAVNTFGQAAKEALDAILAATPDPADKVAILKKLSIKLKLPTPVATTPDALMQEIGTQLSTKFPYLSYKTVTNSGSGTPVETAGIMSPEVIDGLKSAAKIYGKAFDTDTKFTQALATFRAANPGKEPYSVADWQSCTPTPFATPADFTTWSNDVKDNLRKLDRVVRDYNYYIIMRDPLAVKIRSLFRSTGGPDSEFQIPINKIAGIDLLLRNFTSGKLPGTYFTADPGRWWEVAKPRSTPTPGPITPGPITPGPITPGPITPGPVTPGPVTPGPGMGDNYHEVLENRDWDKRNFFDLSAEGKTSGRFDASSQISQEREKRLNNNKAELTDRLTTAFSAKPHMDATDIQSAIAIAFAVNKEQSGKLHQQRQVQRHEVNQGEAMNWLDKLRLKPPTTLMKCAKIGTFVGLGLATSTAAMGILPFAVVAPLLIAKPALRTLAMRRTAGNVLAKSRTSNTFTAYGKRSEDDLAHMMAVLDQKSIRNGYKPVANSNSDAELYSANADRMNKIKAAYNKKVESKILAVVRPGMTPAEVTGHVTRIMKEEQERYFKALEKEREDIMITRYRELFVAAAFAAGIGMLMDYLFNLIPGPDGVDPPPTPPPVPPPPPEDIQDFTGDYSTYEQVFNPNTSLVDVNNPRNLILPENQLEGLQVQVNTLHEDSSAGRLLVHDGDNMTQIVDRLQPNEQITLSGEHKLANISLPDGGGSEVIRMFQLQDANGNPLDQWVAGTHIERAA